MKSIDGTGQESEFAMRLLMASVLRAGGRLVLTEDEVFAPGSFSIEFDPPLKKRKGGGNVRVPGQTVVLTWSSSSGPDDEADA